MDISFILDHAKLLCGVCTLVNRKINATNWVFHLFVYSLLKCLNVFSDSEKVAAWAEARTGFPWIDAIMTQLRDTFSSQQMIDITRKQI